MHYYHLLEFPSVLRNRESLKNDNFSLLVFFTIPLKLLRPSDGIIMLLHERLGHLWLRVMAIFDQEVDNFKTLIQALD